jgi:pseudaminic acid biosynthesis-associated protein pseG
MRREGTEVHFICRDLVGNLNHLVHEQGFPLHVLPRHADDPSLSGYAAWLTVAQETDARETGEVLCTLAPIMRLVVDSYALDEVWERIVRPLVGEIFVIDDLANRKHDCDMLLDQNFYRAMQYRYDGLVPPSCKLLLGPAHALLREEFYAAKKKLRRRDGHLRRVLVFYGGSDATCETEKAIHVLLQLHLLSVAVDVVVGGSNPRRAYIEELCGKHDFLRYHCQVSNMAELMAQADLSLGAGGTTTWERCFLGLPAIVTAIAENQLEVCRDCDEMGYIYYLGRWDEVTEEDIAAAVQKCTMPQVLREMQRRCQRIGGS